MPEGIKEHMGDDDMDVIMRSVRSSKGDRRHARMMFIADDEGDIELSNAYMGAQVGEADNGAQILGLMKDSPADQAGLKEGDIVQRVNGARVRQMEDLLDLLNYYDPNDRIELTISRDGNESKLNLTLGTRPDQFR